jgi:hypothetical protein
MLLAFGAMAAHTQAKSTCAYPKVHLWSFDHGNGSVLLIGFLHRVCAEPRGAPGTDEVDGGPGRQA